MAGITQKDGDGCREKRERRIAGEFEDRRKFGGSWVRESVRGLLCAVLFLGLASAVGFLFRFIGFPETNIVIVYILAVLLTARYSRGFVWGVAASVGATFCFNYFFTSPYWTFSVDNPNYIITFVIMTVTAAITSTLTSRVKKHAADAEERAAETEVLYRLTRKLTEAQDVRAVEKAAAEVTSRFLGCPTVCLLKDGEGGLEEEGGWPIRGGERVLGMLRIPGEKAEGMSSRQRRILGSMLEHVGMAVDRLENIEQRSLDQELIARERYRANLLRSISHDLRTPLSGIMGTCEMLLSTTDKEDPRFEMIGGIYKDADWLHSLVENILSLTRLQDGTAGINKEPEAVEEVIASVLSLVEKRAPEAVVQVRIPDEVMMVPMDARLISQVLLNLLDNALKHTPAGGEIMLEVCEDRERGTAVFRVEDRGEGIAEQDLPNIFQMFYTSGRRPVDVKHGIGLGLTICEAIVNAHGGSIRAENREGGGAAFTFEVPMGG